MATAATWSPDQLVELSQALEAALDPLREALAMQSAVASGVAHEVRELEHVRRNTAVLLREGAGGIGRQAAAAEELRYALARVLRLTSCLERLRPQLPAELSSLDLAERMRGRLAELDSAVVLRSLEVAMRLPRALARGDVSLLGCAVDELLDNAVQHNVMGGWIELCTETLGNRVLLRVSNGGAQIQPEAARQLTQPFKRLRAGDPGGLGLGLTLVERIVSCHGGTLWVFAPPSGGLAVELELPGEALSTARVRRLRGEARCDRP